MTKRFQVRLGIVLMSVLALLLLLRGPVLMSMVWSNAGMLALCREITAQTGVAPATYPVYGILDESPATARVVQALRRAVIMGGEASSARWALGRAALATGDAETSAGVLRPLMDGASNNPLLYHDVVVALSCNGNPKEVIDLYESFPPPHRTRVIISTVALAYLDRSREAREREDYEALGTVRELRPGDLYANYLLWKQAREARDLEAVAQHSEMLAYFPREAIHPSDERFLDYVAEVVPDLLEEGLWDRERTLNVVSFLAWKHPGAAGVERLLEQLIARYPCEPEWIFYLAELHHRRGDLYQAERTYRQVLAVASDYAQVYLRLGALAQAQDRMEEAVGWYNQYQILISDDLLGLKRLAEVCTALEGTGVENPSCREAALRISGPTFPPDEETGASNLRSETVAATLQGALEARTDDRRIVAELLDVPLEDVELGPDLVENGEFEQWTEDRLEGWVWSNMATGDPWNLALFEGGRDGGLDGEKEARMRVERLWVQTDPGLERARAGFWYREGIAVPPGSLYALSFYYRSDGLGSTAPTVWISHDGELFHTGDFWLPVTDGRWHKVLAVLWNRRAETSTVQPLLRNWGSGSVWFDELRLRQIKLKSRSDLGDEWDKLAIRH